MDRRESRAHKFVKLFKYVNVRIEKYVYVYVNIVILNPISGKRGMKILRALKVNGCAIMQEYKLAKD